MLLVSTELLYYRFLHFELLSENFDRLLLDGIAGMTFLYLFEQGLTRNYLRKFF